MRIIKIGKSANNDIVIEGDNTVSRVHIQMFIDDEANVFVTDLNSMNGTFVNGVKINDPVKLNTYDILRVGNSLVNWKEYLSDDVDAQDAYKTIVDEDKQDLLQSLDDIIDDKLPKRRKKKSYVWYAAAAVLLIGVGLFVYLNSDKQRISDKWTSKNNQELSFTFNNDGTFIKDSAGIRKKGAYQLIDGRKKKIKLSFDKASLPVFVNSLSSDNAPKKPFPDASMNTAKLEKEYFGNVFEFRNTSDYAIKLLEVMHDVCNKNIRGVNTRVYVCKGSYERFQNESTGGDGWRFFKNNDEFELMTDKTLSKEIIIKAGETISLFIASNSCVNITSLSDIGNWDGNQDINLSNCKWAQTYQGNIFFNDIFSTWNGIIKYGIMKEDFDYSYEFVDGDLKINGQLFKNN